MKWKRWNRRKKPPAPPPPHTPASAARFRAKVDSSGGPEACWPWMGGRNGNAPRPPEQAPPAAWVPGLKRNRVASRVAYELFTGTPCAPGIVVRQTCGNRLCCNPRHLEAVPGLIPPEKEGVLRKLLRAGSTTREAAAAAGVSQTTAMRFRKKMSKGVKK